MSSGLVFTGERIHPDLPEWRFMYEAHLFGYRDFLRRAQPEWQVLDLGSGEGYGSEMIAAACAACTGMDIAEAAVAHARERYPRPNLTFVAADATQLPFADQSFDAVCSLQVIEHLADTRAFLAGIHRVLRPGGLVYVTTPNRLVFSQEVLDNEFHQCEFSPDELRAALAAVFGSATVEGQGFRDDSPAAREYQESRRRDLARRDREDRLRATTLGTAWEALPPRGRVLLRRARDLVRPPAPSRTLELEAQIRADDFRAESDPTRAAAAISLIGTARRVA